jgi:hypothetical protein
VTRHGQGIGLIITSSLHTTQNLSSNKSFLSIPQQSVQWKDSLEGMVLLVFIYTLIDMRPFLFLLHWRWRIWRCLLLQLHSSHRSSGYSWHRRAKQTMRSAVREREHHNNDCTGLSKCCIFEGLITPQNLKRKPTLLKSHTRSLISRELFPDIAARYSRESNINSTTPPVFSFSKSETNGRSLNLKSQEQQVVNRSTRIKDSTSIGT